jgi:predicted alpha/beta-hydrolase family hydrolase
VAVTKIVARSVKIAVGNLTVSGLLLRPVRAHACFVFAPGAGAGMRHPFMAAIAEELAALGMATLRYQFPYMERGAKRPDAPPVCHATVRAAVAAAARLLPSATLIAGGKSFGGRMTSQAQASEPLAGVRGLALLGFPLHPGHHPATVRADHLQDVKIPLLFVQGTRDALADLRLLRALVKRLGRRATLKLLDDADHAFHVRAKSGRDDLQVRSEITTALRAWAAKLSKRR